MLLLCGIFGNVCAEDIKRTIQAAPALCRAGATVIWTRHRHPPDLTPQVRAWFTESGFEEIAFDALETNALTSVGVSRLGRPPVTGRPRDRLFTFRRPHDSHSGQLGRPRTDRRDPKPTR